MQFDTALIRKHDVRGPRYTSYPTAVQFRDGFDSRHFVDALDQAGTQAAAEGQPLPLSVYVHVPFCATVCYYCACNRIVTNDRGKAEVYMDYLLREMALHGPHVPPEHGVGQLHLGGGTPTYLTDAQLDAMVAGLYRHFRLSDDADRDFSVEIDPRTVDPQRVGFLGGLGFNRLSLGIQDFDPHVQEAVNRIQSEADTAAVVRTARTHGFDSINVDLIYGLPKQTPGGFRTTLERVLRLDPDRIALYSYAHLPERFRIQRQIRSEDLPDAETKLRLLGEAVNLLDAAGYVYIGMDHFARPDDSLVRAQNDGSLQRSFQGYTTHGHCDLVGLGVSAISSVDGVYCQNARDLPAYYAAIDEGRLAIDKGLCLDVEDRRVRYVIQDLMCHFRLDFAAFEAQFGVDPARYFAVEIERLAPFATEGLLEVDAEGIRVTDRGRFLIRNICMVFDRYLGAEVRQFSRAI